MSETKKRLIITFGVLIVFLALLAVGSFFDLEISKAMVSLNKNDYYTSSFFGKLFEIFGETPIYMIASFACFVLYFAFDQIFKSKKIVVALKILICFAVFALNFYATYVVVKYLSEHFLFEEQLVGGVPYVCYALGATAFSLIWYAISSFVPKNILKSLAIWALIVIFTAIFSQITTHSLKPVFARVRYRAMNYIDNFELYTPWYKASQLQPSMKEYLYTIIGSDAYVSFPSGHVTASAICLSLMMLPTFVLKLQNKLSKISLFAVGLIIPILVSVFRVVAGAHFLSDVVVAFMIVWIIFALFYYLFLKRFSKYLNQSVELQIDVERVLNKDDEINE